MNEEYAKLNKLYFGDSVETDEDIKGMVTYSTLLYELLCISYATGYSAAQSLSHR